MSFLREQQPTPYIDMLKENEHRLLLGVPPLFIRYDPEEDAAAVSDGHSYLTRGDWEEIKRLVDRFYQQYNDEDIAQLKARSEQIRHEKYLAQDAAEQRAPARPGYIYLIKSGKRSFKIGQTRNVKSRLNAFRTSVPSGVELIHQIKVRNMDWAESYLHNKFSSKRIHGEWFKLSAEDVVWLCNLTALDPE